MGGVADPRRVMELQQRIQHLDVQIMNAPMIAKQQESRPDRSPSPEPIYDNSGKRVNTRDVRLRRRFEEEKAALVAQLQALNPGARNLGSGGAPLIRRRIYIPVKEHPTYNFIGLIIGPRGNTQKRLERETGCKVAIRGKGAVKEGRGRRDGKVMEEDLDDLHVVITGDNEAKVAAAEKIIGDLLVLKDDNENEWKQQQLRELALINGTARDDNICHICGERGHRQYECPKRSRDVRSAGVRCQICGDSSHITADCPVGKRRGGNNAADMDKEYMSFMQSLGEDGKPAAAAPPVAAAAPSEGGSVWDKFLPKQFGGTGEVLGAAALPKPAPAAGGSDWDRFLPAKFGGTADKSGQAGGAPPPPPPQGGAAPPPPPPAEGAAPPPPPPPASGGSAPVAPPPPASGATARGGQSEYEAYMATLGK